MANCQRQSNARVRASKKNPLAKYFLQSKQTKTSPRLTMSQQQQTIYAGDKWQANTSDPSLSSDIDKAMTFDIIEKLVDLVNTVELQHTDADGELFYAPIHVASVSAPGSPVLYDGDTLRVSFTNRLVRVDSAENADATLLVRYPLQSVGDNLFRFIRRGRQQAAPGADSSHIDVIVGGARITGKKPSTV
jgi:hypothetical protein